MSSQRFYLFDGLNYTRIAYSVAQKSEDPLSAFEALFYKMFSNFARAHAGVYYACWDTAGGTQYKKDIDPQYKSNRSAWNEDIGKAVALAKKIMAVYEVIEIGLPQTEADDTIHMIAKILRDKYPKSIITIVTRDKDLIQTVQKKYANNIFDVVKKKYMDIPEYDIIGYKSLVGDPSDHIKGVSHIGPAKARKYLAGGFALDKEQQKQFDEARSLIDIERNPQFNSNLQKLKETYFNV